MPQAFGGAVISSSDQIGVGTVNSADIANDSIVDADVNSAAAISGSKLQALSVGANAGVIPSTGVANADVAAAAGIVDTKLATISTAGKVSGAALTSLTSVPAAAGRIPLANSPATLQAIISTDYSNSARFTTAVAGSGTATFGTSGVNLSSTATGTSSAVCDWDFLASDANNLELGSPIFSCFLTYGFDSNASAAASAFFGVGNVTVAGAGTTYTLNHFGFKILVVAGVASLYASQADGSTETASSALVTLATNDNLDFICVVNGTTSIDYYYRVNGGSLSAATNLTTNMPGSGTLGQIKASVSNDATAFLTRAWIGGSSYRR